MFSNSLIVIRIHKYIEVGNSSDIKLPSTDTVLLMTDIK